MPISSTSIVWPDWISKVDGAIARPMLSTNADGVTNAQIVDCGGLSFAGLEVSTLSSDSNYSLRGGRTTGTLQMLANTTGDSITLGTTVAGVMPGRTILVDPSKFTGIRYIQVMGGTTTAPLAAPSSGVTIGVLLAAFTYRG